MKTVVINVRSPDEAFTEMHRTLRSGKRGKYAYIHLSSPERLWKLLTEKRWELLKAIAGKGAVTFRKAADLVGRDVKGVHTDLTALIKVGIVTKADGGVVFPYETIKVEYELKATG